MSAKTVYQRGTVVLDRKQTRKLARIERRIVGPAGTRHRSDALLTLAGVPLTLQDEKQHIKCIGITGSGKTTAISHLIGAALARGDRALIADPDGAYSKRLYDASRGDIIFNPFDPRSPQWDIFSEIHNAYDIEDLARSLIPDSPNSHDSEWREYARTFFTDVTQRVWQLNRSPSNPPTTERLHALLTREPVSGLRILLAETPSAAFVSENAEKMFASIRAVTSSAVRGLKYIGQQQGRPLSVREWVRQGKAGRSGVLFMPYHAGEIEALRSTISAWMRIGIFEALNQQEGDQRLWFVVDELGALGRIGGLTDGLTRLRKFGGRVVIGFQSIDQVEALYGKNDANAMVENCGNTLLLRCGTSDSGGTSAFASKLIGEREMMRQTTSRSYATWTDFIGRKSIGEHYHTEPAVLPAQLEQLPNHTGYLRVSSRPEWLQVALTQGPQLWSRLMNAAKHAIYPRESAVPSPSQNDTLGAANVIAHAEAYPAHAEPKADRTTIPARLLSHYIHQGEGVYLHVNTRVEAFRDEGLRLTTHEEDELLIGSLVEIAEARVWKSVTVTGTQGFRRSAWLAAAAKGIEVNGYAPSHEDRAQLKARFDTAHPMVIHDSVREEPHRPEEIPPEPPSRRRFSEEEKCRFVREAGQLKQDKVRFRAFLHREGLQRWQLDRWAKKYEAHQERPKAGADHSAA